MAGSANIAESISYLNYDQSDFQTALESLLITDKIHDVAVHKQVNDILQEVKTHGDSALLRLTNHFDQRSLKEISELCISEEQIEHAIESVDKETLQAVQHAADRIQHFHEKQIQRSWSFEDEWGNQLGQRIQAIRRVGIYVPGGQAAYPSSMLMNAIPAKVAGVSEIVATVPAPRDVLNPLVLAAAHIAGVTKIYSIGGAQAIGALAFGTLTIPKVSKIVGPGNAYVATAKRLVYGEVGIDMIAGPSEIMIIADQHSDANTVALDLFSQAEHDEAARVFCVSTDTGFLTRLKETIDQLWADFPRAKIIQQSLQNHSALIEVPNMDCAVEIANQIAPEHLELHASEAIHRETEFIHAGAIFIGAASSEALGDYCAGPNHVLPTSATARFASPLGVYDFITRTSIIRCSDAGATQLADVAAKIARAEELEAHARSAEARLTKPDQPN